MGPGISISIISVLAAEEVTSHMKCSVHGNVLKRGTSGATPKQ